MIRSGAFQIKPLLFIVAVHLALGGLVAQNSQRPGVAPGQLSEEAKQLDAASPWKDAPFFCYVVPAISSVRRMPDTIPSDGAIADRIALVGAQGEFLPASFVVAPLKDVKSLELKASAMRLAGKQDASRVSQIPAENVDVRVVKVWWQHGSAWHGYHQDKSRRELVPELLLHDDDLIRSSFLRN